MKQSTILIAVMLLNTICCSDSGVNSEKPQNHNPVIFSLLAFPDTIGPTDSVIVICNATDPDADTLVYDWITDGRVRIKGALADDHFLYHTHENSRVVYPTQSVRSPVDSPWVQCFVRDVKGGGDERLTQFICRTNSEVTMNRTE